MYSNIATLPLPQGLKRYQLTSKCAQCPPVAIVAKSEESAWSKFVVQRFGALKPARVDWDIAELVEVAS